MEGGGDTAATKAALRQGMDGFLRDLKTLAREKSLRWKLVCCGGRDQAFKRFSNARINSEASIVVLLVDAEGPVTAEPRDHLATRDDWRLADASNKHIHLMVQTMEAWIVADHATLQSYYGQGFNTNLLPKANNLETVAKTRVADALERATRATQKGSYHKIRHASDLLVRIDPKTVGQRCPNCLRLFTVLGKEIEGL